MKMEVGVREQISKITGTADMPKPVVKKQKSHPALPLSTVTRGIIRSKSSSSTREVHPTPVPSLPTTTISSLPKSPSMPNASSRTNPIRQPNSSEKRRLHEDEDAGPRTFDTRLRDKKASLKNSMVGSGHDKDDMGCYQASSNSVHGLGRMPRGQLARPHQANSTRFRPAEKAKVLNHAPTFPMLSSPTYGELQMPLAFTALTRERGASVSSHTPRHRNNATVPLRPSTSIPDYETSGMGLPRQLNTIRLDSRVSPTQEKDRSTNWTENTAGRENNDREEVRASFRSALTSNSSVMDASGTERSSVVTKSSSTSDFTNEMPYVDAMKEEGMSVEDAIGMYAAGFGDDEDLDNANGGTQSRQDNSEFRQSREIAEAMNDTIGDEGHGLEPAEVVLQDAVTDSKDDLALDLTTIMKTTTTRDRYGFRKATQHVTVQQYDTWNKEYTESLKRRKLKWISLMKESRLPTEDPKSFPPQSAKVKRFVRKGIPPEWRGAAWFWYAGGHVCLGENPGLYQGLVEKCDGGEMSDNDAELIERDLHRTFPDNIRFKHDPSPSNDDNKESNESNKYHSTDPETPIVRSLRRVLRSFAMHNPRIGYCQSLNFLAGLLLLFMAEEKAFWMLVIITTTYLPGTHEVSLEGANVDLWVLMTSIQESMPSIWTKIASDLDGTAAVDRRPAVSNRLPPITLCTTAWFMSCFIGTLPIETVLRVWDAFFYEGSKTLFRIALAIFKIGEHEIKAVNDPMEIFQVVQTIPRRLIDAGRLMDVCFRRRNGFGHLRQETVEERRKERRKLYAEERARIAAGGAGEDESEGGGEGGDKGDGSFREAFKRARTDSSQKLKKMALKK